MGLFKMSCGSTPLSVTAVLPRPPNPDPRSFEVLFGTTDAGDLEKPGRCLVIVRYHWCTNYEGLKILLYDGISILGLMRVTFLDLHFSEDAGRR